MDKRIGFGARFGAWCFAALGERKQALHDLIAGTAVYLKETLETAQTPAAAP